MHGNATYVWRATKSFRTAIDIGITDKVASSTDNPSHIDLGDGARLRNYDIVRLEALFLRWHRSPVRLLSVTMNRKAVGVGAGGFFLIV
jgi:hypothetical protein